MRGSSRKRISPGHTWLGGRCIPLSEIPAGHVEEKFVKRRHLAKRGPGVPKTTLVPGRAPSCRKSLKLDLADKRDGELSEARLAIARLILCYGTVMKVPGHGEPHIQWRLTSEPLAADPVALASRER